MARTGNGSGAAADRPARPTWSHSGMSVTTCHMSISLDGFVAGPGQTREDPIGVGGLRLHQWHFEPVDHEADVAARDWLLRPRRSEEHTSELQSHLNLVCRL